MPNRNATSFLVETMEYPAKPGAVMFVGPPTSVSGSITRVRVAAACGRLFGSTLIVGLKLAGQSVTL